MLENLTRLHGSFLKHAKIVCGDYQHMPHFILSQGYSMDGQTVTSDAGMKTEQKQRELLTFEFRSGKKSVLLGLGWECAGWDSYLLFF